MSYLRQLNEYAVVIMDHIVEFVPLIIAGIIALGVFCVVSVLIGLVLEIREDVKNRMAQLHVNED